MTPIEPPQGDVPERSFQKRQMRPPPPPTAGKPRAYAAHTTPLVTQPLLRHA
jgi:hypothetical protein